MRRRLFGIDEISGRSIGEAQDMPLPKGVFFVEPEFFNVNHGINPHMIGEDGQPHQVDRDLAHTQWQQLLDTYKSIGFETKVFKAKKNCPDMVFCANQSLPYLDDNGNSAALMSNMEHDGRQSEVACIQSSLEAEGFAISHLPERGEDSLLEGMGDALWVPGKKFICGGYGFRTHEAIYGYVHECISSPIVTFELKNPRFYHLDTCLSILDQNTVLAHEGAFTKEGWQDLKTLFANVLEVPADEADSPGFACNAHCPDTKHVLIQRGNQKTERLLEGAGFTPIPLETGEFIKSGGSVFCMKQVYFG